MTEILKNAINIKTMITGALLVGSLCLIGIPLMFSVAIFVVLMVHEIGHSLFFLKVCNTSSKIIFVPFLGGLAVPENNEIKPDQFMWSILGGPITGFG